MKNEKEVAGLRCREVLAHLPDYLDRELDPETRQQVERHLAGCDACARFGGRYADTVAAIRESLVGEADLEVPAQWREKLGRRL